MDPANVAISISRQNSTKQTSFSTQNIRAEELRQSSCKWLKKSKNKIENKNFVLKIKISFVSIELAAAVAHMT